MSRFSKLVLLLLFTMLGFVVDPTALATAPTWSPVDREQADRLLATLDVAPDGTLQFKDQATASVLLGNDWTAALSQMEELNARIRSGDAPKFVGKADLQSYRLKDPYTCDPLDATSGVGSGSDNATTPDAQTQGTCFCSSGCCSYGMCCKSGWWYFCWKYGSC